MVPGDLASFIFKLLQPIDFVEEELLNGAMVDSFQLAKDIEDHLKLTLRHVLLSQHLLQLPDGFLAVLALPNTSLNESLYLLLVLFEGLADVV